MRHCIRKRRSQTKRSKAPGRKWIFIPSSPISTDGSRTLQSFYKHDDDAITSWQGLVKISPADHQGVGQLSSMLVSAGRFDEALKAMQNALVASPDDIELRIKNVDILVRAGKKEGKARRRRKALPAAPLLNADQLNNVAYPLFRKRERIYRLLSIMRSGQ